MSDSLKLSSEVPKIGHIVRHSVHQLNIASYFHSDTAYLIAHQRSGLATWRYSVLRQPGYVADQRYEDENIFYSWALFVSWICR